MSPWLNYRYILTELECFPVPDEARYITAGASIIYIPNYCGLWYKRGSSPLTNKRDGYDISTFTYYIPIASSCAISWGGVTSSGDGRKGPGVERRGGYRAISTVS